MAVKEWKYKPFRYFQLSLFETPLFWLYHELCVSSYPSLLDERAPFLARTTLLAVAGLFEYSAYNGLSAGFAMVFCLLRKLILMEPRRTNHYLFVLRVKNPSFIQRWFSDPLIDSQELFFWIQGLCLQALFLSSFWFRRKTFSIMLLRKYPNIGRGGAPGLFGLAKLILWFLPGLLYHIIVLFISKYYHGGHSLLLLHMMRWYMIILSPPIALPGEEQLPSREPAFVEALITLIWPFLLGYIIKTIIKSVPRLMIAITLKCLNQTYWYSEQHTSAPNIETRPRRLVYQMVCQLIWKLFIATINFAFSLVWKLFASIYRVTVKVHQYAFDRNVQSFDTSFNLTEEQMPSASSIKLVYIRPGFQNDPIECYMEWYDTEILTKTPYTAVSYCWGNDSLCREITVNGNSVMITRSAFAVLKSLRSHYSSKAVWIDAICIDQRSDEEKGRQIPLMPAIYRGATETVVWLGNSATANLAIALVERAFLVDRINKLISRTFMGIFIPQFEISRASAAALRVMLHLPWFERAWVVQEIVRSENVVVRYGSASIEWQRLSWFTEAMLHNDGLLGMINQRCGGKLRMDALRNIQTMNRFALIGAEPQSLSLLFYLVQMFRGATRFQAKQTKDRIYALLGLQNRQSLIQPDYNKTDAQLYIEVARNHLSEASCPLDIITHAGLGHESSIISLPSWVPDWSLNPIALPIFGTDGVSELVSAPHVAHLLSDATRSSIYGEPNSVLGPEKTVRKGLEANKDTMLAALFNAGRKRDVSYDFCVDNDNVLEIQGLVIDEIYCLGKTCPPLVAKTAKEVSTLVLPILRSWAQMVRQVCSQQPFYNGSNSKETREIAFLRTLFNDFSEAELDLTFTAGPTRARFAEDNAAIIFHFLCNLPQDLHSLEKIVDYPLPHLLNHARNWTGKVFGLTRQGYFGIFVAGTKAGDEVIVVHGLRVPLSLRQVAFNKSCVKDSRPKRHELVGAAYVHGIMDGEALNIGMSVEKFQLQ
jgi:hypothetical protein